MNILNTLFPLFFLIALGTLLRWRNVINDSLIKELNKLAFWIGLPSLLFLKVATANSHLDENSLKVVWALLLATGVTSVVAIAFCPLMRLSGDKAGPFIQGAFRGNWAYIGLTVIFLAFANSPDATRNLANDTAAIALGPMVAVFNIAGVVVLLAAKHTLSFRAIKDMLVSMITNPLLLACVFGMIWNQLALPMPVCVARTLETTGAFALPIALLCVGGSMMQTKIKSILLNPAIVSSALKVFLCPLAGYFVARWLGLGEVETLVVLFFLATPAAVNSFTVADQLGCDGLIAAEIVVISTIMSIVSLAVVLGLFDNFVGK